MSFDTDMELEDFAHRFFKNHGAEVEKNNTGLEALLPESLSKQLNTTEYIRIDRGTSGESDSKGSDVYAINYGSQLLENIINVACNRTPLLACKLKFNYLKSQGFDRLIQEQLSFNGSVCKAVSWATINTEYLYLTCRYLAQSDEQKEGLVNLAFNLETGAYVRDMVPMLSLADRDFKTNKKTASFSDEKIREIMEWVKIQTKEAIARETGPFKESMTRRFRRDVTNLEEYYDSLKKEMEISLQRPGLSDELIKDRKDKIALLPDELDRKKDDLFKKYSIKVKIELCSAMLISTHAVKVLCRASIGKKNKELSFIYNPVTKSMDPAICQSCKKSTTSIYFCDHLHLLCTECGRKCPLC